MYAVDRQRETRQGKARRDTIRGKARPQLDEAFGFSFASIWGTQSQQSETHIISFTYLLVLAFGVLVWKHVLTCCKKL